MYRAPRLDDDLILYFKKRANEEKIGSQTLINATQRGYLRRHAG